MPTGLKVIQVNPFKLEGEPFPRSTGKSDDAMKDDLEIIQDNSKFFPLQTLIFKSKDAEISSSFPEVEIKTSHHIDAFGSRAKARGLIILR